MKHKDFLITGDLGEGGGGDGTCFQIWELRPKTPEELMITTIKNLQDCFKLHQVGRYNYNRITLDEAAHLLYLLVFEIMDPNRVHVTVEMNLLGGEFMAKIPHVFNDNNKFGTYPFLRFKHKIDAVVPKLGIKVTPGNKKTMVVGFKTAVSSKSIVLTDPETITDLSNFVKIEKSTGHETYAAETGHDDTIMAAVHAASSLDTPVMKTVIQMFHENLDIFDKNIIAEAMKESVYYESNANYGVVRNAVRNASQYRKSMGRYGTRPTSGRFIRKG